MDWRNNLKRGDRIQVQGNIGGRIQEFTVESTRTTESGRLQVRIAGEWISASCVYARAEETRALEAA